MGEKCILYAASTASHLKSFHLPYIEKLTDEGFRVCTLAAGEGVDFPIPFEKKIFSLKNLKLLGRIRKIIKELAPERILVHTSLAAFWVRMALGRKRPYTVNVVHGYLFSEQPRSLRHRLLLWAERLLARRTDELIVMNAEDRRIAERYRLCRRIRTVDGFGVKRASNPEGSAQVRKTLSAPEEYVLCFAGEFSARKNQEFLIRAMVPLLQRLPQARLWLLGEGETLHTLRELICRLELSRYVHLLGNRRDPQSFMAAADLYVSASRSEGLPFNVAEAMGLGLPTLVSDVKGHRDLLGDSRAGLLYTPENIDDFVNKALQIKENPSILSRQDALDRFQKYSFEQVFEQTYAAMKGDLVP